jgi:glycosyltransferase involved in cell wall biosynthesis
MSPLVSIIIPAYRAAPWLAATLDSALAQTHPRCEIIVVDDGSPDDTLRIASSYADRHPGRLRVFTQPNAGASSARNHGLRLAQGDFIQYLDADDLLAPDKIARQLARLATAPTISIASGPWGRFTRSPADTVFSPEENWRDSPPLDWLRLNFSGRGMMPPAAWLLPRSLTNRVGPWNETLSLNDDGEYFCRALLAASNVYFVPDAYSYYRSGILDSLSHSRSRRAWNSAWHSHEACACHLLAADDTPASRRACADLFIRLAFAMYPDAPDLVGACERRAADLGGSPLRPAGGRAFRIASTLLGWRAARRLQILSGKRPA